VPDVGRAGENPTWLTTTDEHARPLNASRQQRSERKRQHVNLRRPPGGKRRLKRKPDDPSSATYFAVMTVGRADR
jgi:hypothetical protein